MKLIALCLFGAAAFAQLAPNSVTVTASRNATLPADQIVYNVSIGASPDASFDDVLAAVAGAGITAANFRAVNLSSGGIILPAFSAPARIQWLFQLPAPLNDAAKTVALLNAMQTSLAKEKKFTLSYYVGGTQLSNPPQNCPLADLIAEARSEAANLAAAGGTTAGAIQALTTSTAGCAVTARFALAGVGQGTSDTITVVATTLSPQAAPTRIAVTLDVSADNGVGLDQILQTAAPAGVTAADLAGVSQPVIGRVCITTPCNPVDWMFRYTAPIAKLKETLATLASVQAAKHPGITVDYSINADAPPAPACAPATLISQAQKRAADLAAAAGVQVGSLSALSDGPVAVPQAAAIAVFDPVLRTGDFSTGSFTSFLLGSSAAPGCSVTAQFALLR